MEPAIETNDLSVVFPSKGGAIVALDRVCLTVPVGAVVGFLGPNGAGKTTALHVLLGFIPPTAGEARLFGADVRRSIARRRIGYLPEHPDTYRLLSGRESLRMTGRFFGLRGRALDRRVDETLELAGLREAADRRMLTYSRGMLQRICLAQALIADPDLAILDEPTGGLDPLGRMAIREIIAGLKRRGKTVFFSSHELSEVELVCDDLIILAQGRVAAKGRATDLVPAGQSLERFFMATIGQHGGAEHRPAGGVA